MSTRFTRLSVVADERQLDASLPAGRPIAEFLADLPRLLALPVTAPPTMWALSSPAHGSIPLERSLDEAGVVDGDVLYLSPAVDAAESPVVDDVIGAATSIVEEDGAPWDGPARAVVVTCLLAGVAAAATAALVFLPDATVSGTALLAAAVVAVAVATGLRARTGFILGWVAPPVAAGGMYRVLAGVDPDARSCAATAAGALAVAALGLAVHRNRALAIAGGTVAVVAGATSGALLAGVTARALAAWSCPALVLVLGVLPQVALFSSGLVGLVRRAEARDPVERAAVERAVRTGGAVVDGATAAVAVTGAAAAATLVYAGRPVQAGLGGLLALLFLLRSRGFTQARQVGLLLGVAVTAALAAAAALPDWLDVSSDAQRATYWALGAAVVGVLVATVGLVRTGEVAAARLSRVWDQLDLLAMLALVPLVLLAQGVFGWLIDKV